MRTPRLSAFDLQRCCAMQNMVVENDNGGSKRLFAPLGCCCWVLVREVGFLGAMSQPLDSSRSCEMGNSGPRNLAQRDSNGTLITMLDVDGLLFSLDRKSQQEDWTEDGHMLNEIPDYCRLDSRGKFDKPSLIFPRGRGSCKGYRMTIHGGRL